MTDNDCADCGHHFNDHNLDNRACNCGCVEFELQPTREGWRERYIDVKKKYDDSRSTLDNILDVTTVLGMLSMILFYSFIIFCIMTYS